MMIWLWLFYNRHWIRIILCELSEVEDAVQLNPASLIWKVKAMNILCILCVQQHFLFYQAAMSVLATVQPRWYRRWGVIESVRIDRVSVLSGLKMRKCKGFLSPGTKQTTGILNNEVGPWSGVWLLLELKLCVFYNPLYCCHNLQILLFSDKLWLLNISRWSSRL